MSLIIEENDNDKELVKVEMNRAVQKGDLLQNRSNDPKQAMAYFWVVM